MNTKTETLKPVQLLRKAIAELEGINFLAADFKNIPIYSNNINRLLMLNELDEVGINESGKKIYIATDKLKSHTYERNPFNPDKEKRKQILKKKGLIGNKKVNTVELAGWRDVSPWMFEIPKFKKLSIVVHNSD